MKRKCFLAALLLLLGLAGCGDGGETISPAETVLPGETLPLTQPPAPEETPRPSGILEGRQPLAGQENLWYIPNEIFEDGTGKSAALFEDTLLVWGSVYEEGVSSFNLTLLELRDGQVRTMRSLEGLEMPSVQVCGDRIALSDWSNGKLLMLNGELETVEQYQLPADWNPVYLDSRGTAAYSFTRDEGIYQMDLTTGKTELFLSEAADLYTSTKRGDWVTVTWIDRESQMAMIGSVEMTEGRVEELSAQGAFYGVERQGALWLAGDMGEESTYRIINGEQTFCTMLENGLLTLTEAPGTMLRTSYGEDGSTTLTLYDQRGGYLGECSLDAGSGLVLMGDPVWWKEQEGFLLTVITPAGTDALLFWQPGGSEAGENLTLSLPETPQRPAGTAVSEALYQQAEALSETYGLTIYIADQSETEYDTYTAQPVLAEPLIRAGLEELEKALSDYPRGFFDQLRFGNRRTIEIHLVGALTNLEELESGGGGFSNFVGFVEEQGDRAVLALDINHTFSLEQTCHHELFHLIDHKLAFDAGLRKEALYSEEGWNSLNPEGFRYAESLFDLPEDFYGQEYEGWFIDDYSRTFPKEDRARIMEYAMIGGDWCFDDEEGCRAKLGWLAAAIRDGFDTTGWPGVTCWEETLIRASEEES